jgi:hypothetical protein
MPIRFDFGEIRKPYQTHDGTLLVEATFARDGILEYRRTDGSVRRELRLPETNQDAKTLTSYGLAPLTLEHPTVLVNKANAAALRKGMTLQNVRYEGKGGFVQGQVALLDSEAIELATSGEKVELSAGYTCNLIETPGVWREQHYDAIQTDVDVNHVALTTRGRAGPHVRLHFDSADDPDVAFQISPTTQTDSVPAHPSPPRKRMATVHLDGVEYADVPEHFASVAAPRLKRYDELNTLVTTQTQELDSLRSQVSDLEDERDTQEGRDDGLSTIVYNADSVLTELGYRRDADGNYFRTDKAKKKPPETDPEDEAEDMADGGDDEEEEGEDDLPDFIKAKMKKSKMKDKAKAKQDAAEVIDPRLAAKQLMVAWREADQLVVRGDGEPVFSETHFDSVDTPEAVRRLVVQTLRPKLKEKLDSASDAYVSGIYDDLLEQSADEVSDRNDSDFRTDAADNLTTVVNASRSSTPAGVKSQQAQTDSANRRMNAHKRPLTLSTQKDK